MSVAHSRPSRKQQVPPRIHHAPHNGRALVSCLAFTLMLTIGCSGSATKNAEDGVQNPPDYAANSNEPQSAMELAAAGDQVEVGASTFSHTETDPLERAPEPIPGNTPLFTGDNGMQTQSGLNEPGIVGSDAGNNLAVLPRDTGYKIATPGGPVVPDVDSVDSVTPGRELRQDLTPGELVDFLAGADTDMQMIFERRTEITNEKDAFAEMNRIAKLKLIAARRLVDHPDADAKARSEGARGELQALSHLASQGSLKSAQELEELATKNLKSTDQRLVTDSRIVLVGFAIESLQIGRKGAEDKILDLIMDLGSSDEVDSEPNVPAMMIMGHARELLAKYGHGEQAAQVRKRIIDLYASSSDPYIARLAAQVAGNVRFDSIERLRDSAIKGEVVAAGRWRDAVDALIKEAPDLITVQYLAGAALELEAVSEEGLANETYMAMSERFLDESQATGREVKMAVDARKARKSVIGQELAPNLPSIQGGPLLMSRFTGQVVLMPFWASGFPESMQVIPLLKDLEKAHPGKVAIVGMNLDPSDAGLEEFLQKNDLGFPSYHAVSSTTARVANPVAERFGMVSMPFVVIIDQESRVVALDFTGRKLKSTVERLLRE